MLLQKHPRKVATTSLVRGTTAARLESSLRELTRVQSNLHSAVNRENSEIKKAATASVLQKHLRKVATTSLVRGATAARLEKLAASQLVA